MASEKLTLRTNRCERANADGRDIGNPLAFGTVKVLARRASDKAAADVINAFELHEMLGSVLI